jgi:phosphopentomutase
VHTTHGRFILVVLDGVGIGELPDARLYGDEGSNTLANTAEAAGGLSLPHLEALGLGNIAPIRGVSPSRSPAAAFGKMAEASRGKDSTTGHWELAGVPVERAFPTYPSGFPPPLIESFLAATGCTGVLGNTVASGTAIIEEFGEEHLRTGHPIVYTSADSVFQIAAHEEIVPLPRLYDLCRITRTSVCTGADAVGRVIARPFVGTPGSFTRTTNRKDFSLPPFGETVLDLLARAGVRTIGVGKVDDLFDRRGLAEMHHSRSNAEGVASIIRYVRAMASGFLIANLGDFDTLYGHRNDAPGFASALQAFDACVPDLLETAGPHDVFLFTADHGNDPVTPSTDHSREYVPLLVYRRDGRGSGVDLGVRRTFADVGKTAADYFGIENALQGTSFLGDVGGR